MGEDAMAVAGLTALAGRCDARAVTYVRRSDLPARNKAPHPQKTFTRAIATTPVGPLSSWLDDQLAHRARRLLRLPVLLQRGEFGFSTHAAKLGTSADALELRCDDTALGIGLADQARRHCKASPFCALWLEGYWRGMVDCDPTFAVTRVVGPIDPDALEAASHVEIELDGDR